MVNFSASLEFNVDNRKNPEKAFIALRMISHIIANRSRDYLEQILIELLDFAERSPEMVEWDEVDKIFSVWMQIRLGRIGEFNKARRILADLFRLVFTVSCYLQIS